MSARFWPNLAWANISPNLVESGPKLAQFGPELPRIQPESNRPAESIGNGVVRIWPKSCNKRPENGKAVANIGKYGAECLPMGANGQLW